MKTKNIAHIREYPRPSGNTVLFVNVSLQTRYLECCKCFSSILALCDYSTASKAFIFSLYNTDGYNPVKLTQYQNQEYGIYGCSNYGPTFGSNNEEHDIYISGNGSSNAGSYTNCGGTYSVPSGYSAGICGFFTGGHHFTPTDIEVFYEIGNKY